MSQTVDYADVLQRWYQCNIPREDLKKLMQRSDLKGLIRTAAFFAVLIGLGILSYQALQTGRWWLIIPAFLAYGTVYCFLNHLMHETHHRTVFKSVWLNEVVHWIAGFAHGAEPIYDRWGHTQHHTYTYHIGNDPEVVTPRPANIPRMLGQFFGIGIIKPLPIIKHALGIIPEADRKLVPESDWKPMIWSSRLWLLGYGAIIASCFYFHTILPLVYTLFARFYGAFYPTLLNDTQHIGLEENVYDHRLCTRNVRVGPITSFLYWDMQYHIEHHMYPGVPFHALRKLHAKVKDQLPQPHRNVWAAYRDILPTIFRQQREKDFHITPVLPAVAATASAASVTSASAPTTASDAAGLRWVALPGGTAISENDVIPFEHEGRKYAVYRLKDSYHATDGKCTHSGALLARGLVIDDQIECPAHQGRFDIRSGKATHSPACGTLNVYPVRVADGRIQIGLPAAGKV